MSRKVENAQSHLSVRPLFEFPVVLKLEAAVARSTFVSENVQNTAAPPEVLFEVLLSKNCMRLWREAHLQVKMLKN